MAEQSQRLRVQADDAMHRTDRAAEPAHDRADATLLGRLPDLTGALLPVKSVDECAVCGDGRDAELPKTRAAQKAGLTPRPLMLTPTVHAKSDSRT